MVFTPPSVVAPNDGALGQASPKDAQRRHVATLAISLVFCPLSIIELFLPGENESYQRILQKLHSTFFRNTSYGPSSTEVPSSFFASLAVHGVFALRIIKGRQEFSTQRRQGPQSSQSFKPRDSQHLNLPHSIRHLRCLNLHFQKPADHLNVSRRVTRKRQCSETAATRHRHRNRAQRQL